MNQTIKATLEGIEYEFHEHEPVHTVEMSRKISIPGAGCKNLFLRSRDEMKFVLITMPGEKRLDIKNLEERFKIKKLRFASEEELFQKLNTKPGHVSPFAIVNDEKNEVTYLIDKEVWNSKEVNFHSDINSETIVVDKENFHKLVKKFNHEYEVIDL